MKYAPTLHVFPAGAGVIPEEEQNTVKEEGFPRRCGGDPIPLYANIDIMWFSPQVRG